MYEQKLQLLKVRYGVIRIIFRLTIGKIAWVIEAEVPDISKFTKIFPTFHYFSLFFRFLASLQVRK